MANKDLAAAKRRKNDEFYTRLTDIERECNHNIRAFTENMKREAYERQNGMCAKCGKHFEIDNMEGDHITPWHSGGKTIAANCQILCKECNRRKGGI